MPFHKFPFQNALNAHIFLAMRLSNGLGFNSLMTEAVFCSANRWTGFYMITASVMKELKAFYLACLLEKLDDQIKLTYDVVILHSYLKKCKDGEI